MGKDDITASLAEEFTLALCRREIDGCYDVEQLRSMSTMLLDLVYRQKSVTRMLIKDFIEWQT